MILEKDGKYYFDVEPKKELEYQFFIEVRDKIIQKTDSNLQIESICRKQFYFELNLGTTFIYDNSQKKTEISNSPTKIKFKTKNKTETRYIFSLDQYKKTLLYFGISFPWSKDLILNENNLKKLIYNQIIINKLVTVEDANVFDIKLSDEKENKTINELKKNIKKLEDLSKYISFYIKNNIDLFKYEEKNFIKEKDFVIQPNSEFQVFDITQRMQLWYYFQESLQKEYFFTGPYSIGKTFTLLLFANYDIKCNRKAYYNLETYRTNKQYFEIIAYESRHLFNGNESWKEEFLKIQDKGIKDPFSIIIYLINLVSKEKESKTKYFFILDQIKFQNNNEKDLEFQGIKAIRNAIKNSENCFLIGCCSINYKGVKDILFENWFFINEKKCDIEMDYINTFKEAEGNSKDNNKYLKILGNLPRYKNIKNILNKKIINILTKKIKEKIEKFYNKNELLSLHDLKKIEINKPFQNENDFKIFLEKIPFKYFIIDIQNYTVDYTYPLVKRAIYELLNTYELNKINGLNEAERGWNFERKVIDKIKTTHVFGDFYIDNYYEIPSIFRKYKIEDEYFDSSENTLFYFTYLNVRRYDCAIYIGDKKKLLLIQISKRKSRKQLEKYKEENFKKDIDDMQKFLKINKLSVKKYLLLFILDEENYKNRENYEMIEEFKFKYCLYNFDNNCFTSEIPNFYEINYSDNDKICPPNEEPKLFEFEIRNNNFIYDNIKAVFKFYAEKEMKLKDFLEQTIDEDILDIFREKFLINEEQYFLDKISTLIENNYTGEILDIENGANILFFNLSDNIIYLGKGKIKNGKCKLTFECLECTSTFSQIHKCQDVLQMTGFIFKSTVI